MRKGISLLGSTGSIGRSTLEVLRATPERFKVVALAAGRNVRLLKEQIDLFKPRLACVVDAEHAAQLESLVGCARRTEIVYGQEGYRMAVQTPECRMVLSAMVGAAGLAPTLAAIEAGKDIALANKETLVIAGQLVMEQAKARGVALLPVDSEHSAVFQCLEGHRREDVKRILLTASGGPFWRWSRQDMEKAGPAEALRHPNWTMGSKISIDSATMMNKGLEVIEAHWLFGIPYDQISVLIHPQSVVHSLVEYVDGSVIAQLGQPDMKIPIAYALAYPGRIAGAGPPLDLTAMKEWTFMAPDEERFPCLRLARQAGIRGGLVPAVMNGANEMAVAAFLEGRLRFTDIAGVVEETMGKTPAPPAPLNVEAILEADRMAREITMKYIEDRNR